MPITQGTEQAISYTIIVCWTVWCVCRIAIAIIRHTIPYDKRDDAKKIERDM
jgi:hypothetical protein